MISSIFNKIKNLLYIFPPELSHSLSVFMIKNSLVPEHAVIYPNSLTINFFGNQLDTPIGLAAGFDKNGEIIAQVMRMGFGFVEVGTITPKPQRGNPTPRLFRLPEDEAIINRLGFNNKGVRYFLKNMDGRSLNTCNYGINIGCNKNAKDRIKDYTDMLKIVYGLSDYVTLNVSSPNTPGLRDLQKGEYLRSLLKAINDAKASVDTAKSLPVFLKVSPDIRSKEIDHIISSAIDYNITGIIVSNTIVHHRENLRSKYRNEVGGLSGKPLFEPSTRLLAQMYDRAEKKLLFIGCGGVSSGHDAYQKIQAGASLIQLYTALVYHGPRIAQTISMELADLLQKDGFSHVREAVGYNYRMFL